MAHPSSDAIFTEVYENPPWHLEEQWDEMKKWRIHDAYFNMVESVNNALDTMLSRITMS